VRMGIGGHHRPRGLFDVWLTPRQLLAQLGPFDLDPCAAPEPRPWPTAKTHIALPADGLASEWKGRVWLNPPYHRDLIGLWLEKMARHANAGGTGIALIFARTETDAWQRWVWPFANAVLFLRGRLEFCLPDGTRVKHNCGAPSALIAYSEADATFLKASGIRGAVTRFIDLQ
jgi:DNA N-6-adenine-methyltransferase (Dam)